MTDILLSGDDDIYEKLSRSFLPKGKGRHLDPPQVPLTNRLLLQLRLLQTEHGKTAKDVSKWFERLYPNVSYPSSRLSGVFVRLMKKVTKMHEGGEDLAAFLATEVDFDFVSASLTSLGLKRGQLMARESALGSGQSCVSPNSLTHQVIVDLENFRSKEKLSDKFTIRWVKALTGSTDSDCDKAIQASVKQLMACYTKLATNSIKIDNGMLSLFLTTSFKLKVYHQPEKMVAQGPSSCSTSDDALKLKKYEKQALKEKSTLQEQVSDLQSHAGVLKETIQELSQEKNKLIQQKGDNQKLQEHIGKLQKLIQRQKQMLSGLNPEKLQYLRNRNLLLKDKLRANRSVHDKLGKLKQEHKELSQTAFTQKQSYERSLRRMRVRIQQLEEQLAQNAVRIEPVVEERQKPETRFGRNNRYSDSMRQTCMHLQSECNLSAGKIRPVIQVVAENLFGVHFEDQDLPNLQTSINMMDEGHCAAKMQAAMLMKDTQNFTLHTDGTSRGGDKIMAHQITMDNGATLSLGFCTLASEDACTVLEVTVSILREVADLYCTDRDEDQDHFFKTLLSKLTSVMTDRAAVMKSFDEKLLAFLQSELGKTTTLHFLNCNAHFLLGLSRACEIALGMIEKDLTDAGGKLGRDCLPKFQRYHNTETATARVIRLTCAPDLFTLPIRA